MTEKEKSTEALWEFLAQDARNVDLIVCVAGLYACDENMYKLFKQAMENIEYSFDLIKHGYRADKCSSVCGIIKNILNKNNASKTPLEAVADTIQAVQDYRDYPFKN